MTFTGSYGAVLDGCVPNPIPIEYLQRKYGARLPARLLTSFNAMQTDSLYASPSYKASSLARLVRRLEYDLFNSPSDLWSGPYRVSSDQNNVQRTLVPNPYYTALPPDPHHPRPARIQWVEVTTGDQARLRDIRQPAFYKRFDLALFYENQD